MSLIPYTFPVENTTKLDPLKFFATAPGSRTLIAQVSEELPVVPNFFPTIKMMFLICGSFSSCFSSSRSASMTSTPASLITAGES